MPMHENFCVRTRMGCRGFTMIEFMLVVVISAILMVGLAAVVDVPLQMAERDLGGGLVASNVDRVIAILDQDVRFAKTVASPDSSTLAVTDQAGNSINYSWDGISGGGLTRSSPDGSSVVLTNVETLAFRINLSDMRVAPGNLLAAVTPIRTASFDAFQVKPGYSLAVAARLVPTQSVSVTETVSSISISSASRGGIVFTATGLGTDAALPVAARLRMRRGGTSGLKIQIFRADGTGLQPDHSREVAVGYLKSAATPVSFADVLIPLTPVENVVEGGKYFLELRASPSGGGNGTSVDLEARTLSDPDAAVVSGHGFMHSTDGGGNYAPLVARLDASQTVFQLDVSSTAVLGSSGSTTVQVPTSVDLRVKLDTGDGTQTLRTNFTVDNLTALVHQSNQN